MIDPTIQQVVLGADHGGWQLKEGLKTWLAEVYPTVIVDDCGADHLEPGDDYPQYALAVANKVATQPDQIIGIVCCRSSAGVVIAANKVAGIRAVAIMTTEQAQLARSHNGANVMGLAGDQLDLATAQALVTTFLSTVPSSDERHVRRRHQIAEHETQAFLTT